MEPVPAPTGQPIKVARTKVERDAQRNVRELRRAIGQQIRQAREDLGISIRRLAEIANVSKSHLDDIERADCDAGVAVLARISAALGGKLGVRFEPGTGPVIRDHIQAAMIQATVKVLHMRWRRFLEVSVHRPVRGVIDLVLHDPVEPAIVAGEAQSQIRRVEQQIRWAGAKADALLVGGSDVGAAIGRSGVASGRDGANTERPAPTVSRLLLLRSTRANRELVTTYRDLFAAAYPASHVDAVAALTGTRPWPGSALVWLDVRDDTARILERPPRGVVPTSD